MSKIIIYKEEIKDFVDCDAALKIGEIFNLIKEDCEFNSIPILNNPQYNAYENFVEIILECLDINQIYKKKNKLDA